MSRNSHLWPNRFSWPTHRCAGWVQQCWTVRTCTKDIVYKEIPPSFFLFFMICGFCFWEIRENNMNSNSKNTNTFPVFQLKKNIPKSPNQKDDFTSLHLQASHPHPAWLASSHPRRATWEARCNCTWPRSMQRTVQWEPWRSGAAEGWRWWKVVLPRKETAGKLNKNPLE